MEKELKDKKPIKKYRDTMYRIIKSQKPWLDNDDLYNAIDYSINKRYKSHDCSIYNNYTEKRLSMELVDMVDYIMDKKPIMTSYGVLFKPHDKSVNLLTRLIDEFMFLRDMHKGEMFKYPKFSEMFEHYNLMQSLDKIDVNAIYGLAGLYVSIIYNLHVAPSITSMGRSLISSAICCFEMFLSNNVKFGSLDEALVFIDNVRQEKREFDDFDILDQDITPEECFYKVATTFGYKYIPTEKDLQIVWDIICGCNQEELNRLYYKNNIYSFLDNTVCKDLLIKILVNLDVPYMEPMKPPKCIEDDLNRLKDLLLEYVFYNHQVIDRMDRNKNMIKNISIISDTDSSFVCLDVWYHYVLDIVKGMDMNILHQELDVVNYCKELSKEENSFVDPTYLRTLIKKCKVDEYGDLVNPDEHSIITFLEPNLDYDFYNQKIIEEERFIDILKIIPQDNLKFSIINIMAYVLNSVINKYMLNFTKQSNSYRGDDCCKIIMKNEFYMYRILLEKVMKHYASIQGVQEGNYLGPGGIFDVKGIDCMAKSTYTQSTRESLIRIMAEDILRAEDISQLKVMKDIAILETNITNDLLSGSKKYYKPLTIKGIGNYEDPMRQQGIKGEVIWNFLRDDNLPAFDLSERNSIDIVKVNINKNTIDKVKDKYPDLYSKLLVATSINNNSNSDIDFAKAFKGQIDYIGVPKDTPIPEWVLDFIDIPQIIADNLSGFPLDSIGISKLDNRNNVNYTNVVKL